VEGESGLRGNCENIGEEIVGANRRRRAQSLPSCASTSTLIRSRYSAPLACAFASKMMDNSLGVSAGDDESSYEE
jgi:hypothetical protein